MLTPSSRRRLYRLHCHLLCLRLRLPLRPRLALVEGAQWQIPTDQKHMSGGIPEEFCSCPMVRLVTLVSAAIEDGIRLARRIWRCLRFDSASVSLLVSAVEE